MGPEQFPDQRLAARITLATALRFICVGWACFSIGWERPVCHEWKGPGANFDCEWAGSRPDMCSCHRYHVLTALFTPPQPCFFMREMNAYGTMKQGITATNGAGRVVARGRPRVGWNLGVVFLIAAFLKPGERSRKQGSNDKESLWAAVPMEWKIWGRRAFHSGHNLTRDIASGIVWGRQIVPTSGACPSCQVRGRLKGFFS